MYARLKNNYHNILLKCLVYQRPLLQVRLTHCQQFTSEQPVSSWEPKLDLQVCCGNFLTSKYEELPICEKLFQYLTEMFLKYKAMSKNLYEI